MDLDNDKLLDEVSTTFQKLLPVFKRHTANMKGKQFKRVLNAIVEYPLQDGKLQFMDQIEVDTFQLGIRLLDCKTVMMNAFLEEKAKKEIEDGNEEKMDKSGNSTEE